MGFFKRIASVFRTPASSVATLEPPVRLTRAEQKAILIKRLNNVKYRFRTDRKSVV